VIAGFARRSFGRTSLRGIAMAREASLSRGYPRLSDARRLLLGAFAGSWIAGTSKSKAGPRPSCY